MNLQFLALHRGAKPALAIGLLIAIFFSSLGSTVSFGQTTTSKSTPDNEHFLLYQAPDGDTICREATIGERDELEKIIPKNLRRINHTEKAFGPAEASHGGQHLTIILLGTANLNSPDGNAPLAKAAFIRAAAAWESVITSPVTVYIEVDYGPDNFGAAWSSGTLGAASSPLPVNANISVFRNNLINGANTSAKLAVYSALPSSSIPIETATGTTSSSLVSVSRSIARATGLLNPTALESDPRPRIGFNSNFSFDFDPSNGISGGTDFEAVATHEIGHALGFTSRSGSSSTTPAVWDLYRFRSGTSTATFTSAPRIMAIGGPTANSQYYFIPGQAELGLSDGGPDAVDDNNADGNQSSHWRQQSKNNGIYIGIMDPRIPQNTRRLITENDINALNIFGYNSIVQTPPNDNFISAQVLSGCSGSVNGTNVLATHESGEPNHSPDGGGGSRSVWYQWQAPASTSTTFSTAGSTFDTVLAVYTGSSVSSLSEIGKIDDNSADDKTGTLTFNASAGTVYRIAVDGYNNFNSGGDVGPITLNWSTTNCTTGTPQLQLMLAQSGAIPDQVAAVDSVLLITDPFPVINSGNLINPASDRNTRVVVFVAGLSLSGQPASSVVVNLVDGSNQSRDIPAQDVRLVPNFNFSQVTFRLPDNLPPGTYKIKVVFGGLFSNTANIRVRV